MNTKRQSEKRKIIRDFIVKNPTCTYLDIKNNTKIKVERIYQNMPAAFLDAGVALPIRYYKRNKDNQKEEVISFLKRNPGATVIEIQEVTGVNIPREFGSIKDVYKLAGVRYPEREVTSGVMNPDVCKRSILFEKFVVDEFSKYGEVFPKVRCNKGITDAIFVKDNIKYVVEVKDFRGRNNITKSQIKQILRYMKDLDIREGFIVCPEESFPKRNNSRNLFIGDFKIRIISPKEICGGVV
ncbi:hypothetical protein HOA92_04275 [archaeon]|jgi:hypothetical protein|nr:hypothetical protein [archaeon]MBT6762231.1 hypothetical protein [archaeon]